MLRWLVRAPQFSWGLVWCRSDGAFVIWSNLTYPSDSDSLLGLLRTTTAEHLLWCVSWQSDPDLPPDHGSPSPTDEVFDSAPAPPPYMPPQPSIEEARQQMHSLLDDAFALVSPSSQASSVVSEPGDGQLESLAAAPQPQQLILHTEIKYVSYALWNVSTFVCRDMRSWESPPHPSRVCCRGQLHLDT